MVDPVALASVLLFSSPKSEPFHTVSGHSDTGDSAALNWHGLGHFSSAMLPEMPASCRHVSPNALALMLRFNLMLYNMLSLWRLHGQRLCWTSPLKDFRAVLRRCHACPSRSHAIHSAHHARDACGSRRWEAPGQRGQFVSSGCCVSGWKDWVLCEKCACRQTPYRRACDQNDPCRWVVRPSPKHVCVN